MVKIKRIINSEEVEIILTKEEIKEVFRQDNVQWAKDILANYADMIIDYERVVEDEEKLLSFAELLEEKNLADNGDREIAAIEELFEINEEY